MSAHRALAALVVMSLTLVASASPSSAAAEPATEVSAITLVEQRLIEIPGSRLLALSPDGGSIVVARPDGSGATELCIHGVATLAERVCADLRDLDPAGSEDAPMLLDAGWVVADPWALAERGVSVISAQAPDQWSEFMLDADPTVVRTMVEAVACAVRFARGSEYGSETAPLVLTGFSRHGMTASHVALVGEDFDRAWDEYTESADGPPALYDCTVSEASTRVDGFVGIGGGNDAMVGYAADSPYGRDFLLEHEPDLWEMLWATVGLHPELRVRLIHGDSDSTIPFENSAAFEAVLAEAGYDVELIEFAGGHQVPHDLMVETVMELVS